MIKDYRFHSDAAASRKPGRLPKLAMALLLTLGSGAMVYTALGYGTAESSLPPHEQVSESSSVEIIALALPSQTRLELVPVVLEKTPVIEEESLPSFDEPQTAEETLIDTGSVEPSPPETENDYSESAQQVALTDARDERDSMEESPLENEAHWHEETVKRGDSLSKIFSRLNLSANLLHRIINSSKEAKQLSRIKPGETLKVKVDDEGNFLALILERNAIKSLNINAEGDDFVTKTIERGLETRIATASGTITSSLYQGAQRAGLSDQLIMELANIFGWDIDFALEIRAGDHFSLIYENEYLDGEFYANGPILAAEFINRGEVFRAVRHLDDKGNSNYFSPDGRSMRKAFLRAPVDFRRISSRFTKARWHPVLGKKRPHKGVDYAAATGTPIKAAGDGRVIFRGSKGGYGKTVIIQHGNQYTTLYGHMSNYKRSVNNGSRVKQGQTIGYVGKSGLATGPHLHYEFRVNGVHRNPLTVKIPAASPINKEYKADFLAKSKPLLAQLDLISRTQVATTE